ncbi:MAG: metallophosphatase family protein [Euryarchaeota archaeon]|nr:metallophosphatase family protein [Euryarchaeota archaeon]
MRIAFISDVHANIVALKAVLEDVDKMGIQTIVSAGDVVGYYPFPNETIRTLRDRKVIGIRGNHDRSVLTANTNMMNMMASAAVRWTVQNMEREGMEYLRKLKDHMDFHVSTLRATVHHGSPFDEDEYVFEHNVEDEMLKACPGSKMLVLGHTHVPYVVHLERGYVINPGSVGQPRDGDPRACYILHDTTKDSFEIRRVEYDISAVEEAVMKAGLPSKNASRLRDGV